MVNSFDFIIGRESLVHRFVKTDSIKKIIRDLGLKFNEVLVIGDINIDFIEGSKAGLTNILIVDYGWGYNLKVIPDYKQKVIVK